MNDKEPTEPGSAPESWGTRPLLSRPPGVSLQEEAGVPRVSFPILQLCSNRLTGKRGQLGVYSEGWSHALRHRKQPTEGTSEPIRQSQHRIHRPEKATHLLRSAQQRQVPELPKGGGGCLLSQGFREATQANCGHVTASITVIIIIIVIIIIKDRIFHGSALCVSPPLTVLLGVAYPGVSQPADSGHHEDRLSPLKPDPLPHLKSFSSIKGVSVLSLSLCRSLRSEEASQ
ncbi:uncharacterized protein LOC124090599 [Marmota monax]|uniref:uncharacterized protein LOC124090599 n=1 Tax=Marmota monax TaxID=9995 RepID=UPI0026EA5E87|nr:uncharacterized protein LOC124090599 [Marmota monax]